MSEHSCPTVKVKTPKTDHNPQGSVVINECDFDPAVHELYEEVAEKPLSKAEKAAAEKAAADTPWAPK